MSTLSSQGAPQIAVPTQRNTTMALNTTMADQLISPTAMMPQISTAINFKRRLNQNETSIGKIRGDTYAGFSTLTTLANSKQLKTIHKERNNNSIALTSYFRSTAPGFAESTAL